MLIATWRPYRTTADLLEVGRLIRRGWATRPHWNAWTFARWDIWAQRRIADERLAGLTAWHDDLVLLPAPDGSLGGAAFLGDEPNEGVVILDPEAPDGVDAALDWLVDRYDGRTLDEALVVDAPARNRVLAAGLERRGFQRLEGHWVVREKSLAECSPIDVAPGCEVRIHAIGPGDVGAYNRAVHAVFGRSRTNEAFEVLREAPSYDPDLGVIAVNDDGRVLSFCHAWVDHESGVAEIEPIGTVPGRQRLGLASAVIADLEGRLRDRGIPLVTVLAWGGAEPANRLYDRLDYRRVARQDSWELAD